MESFIVDLKNKVQCSLCNDTLIEPKILQCFHTFCKPCIKRHAKLIEQVNVFKCPKCSSQTSLPEPSSVEDLQTSLLHSRMLKGLALVEGEKVCSVSESHSPASWYCFNCDRKMCDECRTYHSEFIKDHKVVRLSGLKKKDIEMIITRENPCKSHPNHRIELFCQQCQKMICVACLKHDHKDHTTLLLNESASVKKDVLSKHLQVLEHLISDDKEKQQQENIANTIKQQGEKARKQVQERTNEIIKMVQETERELLKQIDEKLDTATTNLNIIQHLPAVKEYLQNVMERGLASEMINIQDTQSSEKFIFNPIPLYSTIAFVPNEDFNKQVNSYLWIGVIKSYSETDHTMSTIQVESKIEAARKEKLILMTKTSTGKNSINTGDVVDVQISPEDHVKMEEKYVRSEGKIEVEFMAKVAGRLTAEVQVNGNRVSNSPLVMDVKPQQMRTRQFYMRGVNTGSHSLTGIAVNRDNSRIAVADASSHCVHVFNTDGDLLLTYGSQGSAQGQLSCPEGLAFLNDTDLVIADRGNHRICIVNTTVNTIVNTLAWTLAKTFGNQGNRTGEFSYPCGVHVDDDGNIIVSDTGNHRIQVFTRDGRYISQYQCQYEYGKEQRKFDPVSTVTHGGLLYVSDRSVNVIRVFKKGNVPTSISRTDGYVGGFSQLRTPCSLAIDNDHHLLVVDDNGIKKITKNTGCLVGMLLDISVRYQHIAVLNDGQVLVTTYGSGVWMVK